MSEIKNENENIIDYETFLNQKRITKIDYYEYLKQDKKYTDELYPPNDYSLYSQNSKGEFYDKDNGQKYKDEFIEKLKEDNLTIQWLRISDQIYFSEIYNENVSHEQIEQGNIGNCYLMSLMASISHFPKLIIGDKNKNIPHLLYNIEYGDIGYYEILLFIDGHFKIVIIDDYIPFYKENELVVFGNSSENYFWVNLVEKAYSKICGGYTSMKKNPNIIHYNHFQVFTGYKCETFFLHDGIYKSINEIINNKESEKIYKIVEENLKNDSKQFNIIINAGTPKENKGILLEENYIPYQHGFSILDCTKIKVNKDKEEMILLLLNNPWGRNVYNEGIGQYCLYNLNDDIINLKPFIESNINSQDGSFWIDYDTFIKCYDVLYLCKIPCNYYCINYSLSNKKNFELPLIYKLNLEKKTNIWFNVNIDKSNLIISHSYEINVMIFLDIFQINNEGKIIKNFSSKMKMFDLQVDYDLEEGDYLIWLYIPKKYVIEIDKLKGNFRVSSNNKINIQFSDYDKDFKFIVNSSEYIFNLKHEQEIKEKEKDKSIIFLPLLDYESIYGIVILYFKNNSDNIKIDISLEGDIEEFKSIKSEDKLNFRKLKFCLIPKEYVYFIGITSDFFVQVKYEREYTYYSGNKFEQRKPKGYLFFEYLKEKDEIKEEFNIDKYATNTYCFKNTHYNKDIKIRDEENVFNYFLNLMSLKLCSDLTTEKIKYISQNLWRNMQKEEKIIIRKKYNERKKELKKKKFEEELLEY